MIRIVALSLIGLATASAAHAQVDSVFSLTRYNAPLLRVNANGHVGIATQTPDRRLVVDSGGVAFNGVDGFVATGVFGQGTIPASGIGPRVMWYPRKAAFRAGNALNNFWDDVNVGDYSIALGSGTIASGSNSAAFGAGARAAGFNSVALGSSHAEGGYSTTIGSAAHTTGQNAFAAGYFVDALADRAVALGFSLVADGANAVVIGSRASSNTFAGGILLSDNSISTTTNATAANQFMVRAAGGTIIYSSSSGGQGTWTGVRLNAGSGAWASLSDRNRKRGFQSVDGEEVLGRLATLPLSTWSYVTQDDAVRHMGPTAQDFRAAFGLGEDSVTISTVDADGVALAAAQALEARTARLSAEVVALRRENEALRAQLADEREAIERRLRALEQR